MSKQKELQWFSESIRLFKAVKFDGKTLSTKEFFEAAINCKKLYRFIWGGGLICRQVEKDLEGSAGPCLLAFHHNPDSFHAVHKCPKEKLHGIKGFKKGLDTRDKMLWAIRAMRFIVCILHKLVEDPALEVHVAAKFTYNAVLAPHHSWPIRQIARTALSQCPWRRNMLRNLEMSNTQFLTAASRLLGVMSPLVTHANDLLIEWGLEHSTATVGTILRKKPQTDGTSAANLADDAAAVNATAIRAQ